MDGYYILKCETCRVELMPVCGTIAGELTAPDWDDLSRHCGECGNPAGLGSLGQLLKDFHDAHAGHRLAEQWKRIRA